MSDFLGWRLFRYAADTTAERLDQKREIENQNGPDTSELIWAADEKSPDLGLRIVRPRTREDYYYEGMLQNNCISGLQIDAYNNYPVVYSVRDENNLPLVSYEARYVPLTSWQADPYERDQFFGSRESDDPDDHHVWNGPQDGLGVLMTRQVCSVGNHVPGEEKLMSFLKANIAHMKQRGLSYMQYITAEGEHQPGTCQEGCPTQERESLQTNPLLSLDDLEAIVDSKNRKVAPGTKVYLQAPFYSLDKNGEINADKHRGSLSIIPVGPAFKKEAQADDDGEMVNIEGRQVRVPRDHMVVQVPFSERTITQGEKIHDMLLNREGGGGMSIVPGARFTIRDRDIVHRRTPSYLAVTEGEVSPGLNTVSSNSGDFCLSCLPKNRRFLKVNSGQFVYEDELENHRDKVLIPINEGDLHKFRKNSNGDMEFNELDHAYVPIDAIRDTGFMPPAAEGNFSSITKGQVRGHSSIGDNPTGFSIYPHDIKSSVSDDEKKRIADSTYGIFADPNEFAPHAGRIGKRPIYITDGPDSINHHKEEIGLSPSFWLLKAGSDAFHHVKREEHMPAGTLRQDGTARPATHQCGTTNEDKTIEGSCGQEHFLYTVNNKVKSACSAHGADCVADSGISLKDLIYVGPDHDFEGRGKTCSKCGLEASKINAKGEEIRVHPDAAYMEEPHFLWDSGSQQWKKNVDENGRELGGTKRALQYGQDMGAPDFHLVPSADEHLESIKPLTSQEHGAHIPSNISFKHNYPSRAAHIGGESSTTEGIPLSLFLDSSLPVIPGSLFDTTYPLTAKRNPELFATSDAPAFDGETFINPEKVDVQRFDEKNRYHLKQEVSNPLTAPEIYYRGMLGNWGSLETSNFSDDGSPSTQWLELSRSPLTSTFNNAAELGEISTYKLKTPEYVCRACGKQAELEDPEEGKEDKNTYKVICPEHSKQFLQCPGGKAHRTQIRVQQENGTTLNIAAPSDNDKIEYLGQDKDGSYRIHCRVCKDRCPTCSETGFQTTIPGIITDRGTNPKDDRLCSTCKGVGAIDTQEQKALLVREPVAGQRRGTVGLITPENIVLGDDDSVRFVGNSDQIVRPDGSLEYRHLKMPASAMISEGTGIGMSRGKAERLRAAMWRQFRTVSFVKQAADADHDPRLPKLQKLRSERHNQCGSSGIYCDGSPHDDPKERELWSSKDGKYSIKHLLNSDAFFTEGTLQSHCLAYNYQYNDEDGDWHGRDPNPVSLRDKDDVPLVTGDFRVVSKSDFDSGYSSPNQTIRGVPWDGYGKEDWREEDPEKPIPLPDGSAHLINPLFSNDTWSKEIIDPKTGEKKPHPDKGVLISAQVVKERDQNPENDQWLPFLRGLHDIMTDRDIDYFWYQPYQGGHSGNLIHRNDIGGIISRFDIGDKLKDKKVYVQLPIGNWDPRNPNVVMPDSQSKILPVGEAFDDVA